MSGPDYNMTPIPTVYRGRRYRSRLEARWAAFFDLLGWEHEYEPVDLGGWSPDFRLMRDAAKALAEVKPITALDESVAAKMEAAADASGYKGPLLLLGETPTKALGWVGEVSRYSPQHGGGRAWRRTDVVWAPDVDHPRLRADFVVHEADGHEYAFFGSIRFGGFYEYPNHVARLWAEATNAVQYRPEARP